MSVSIIVNPYRFGIAETLPPQTNLVAWYDASEAYVTKSANLVSQWSDRKNSNHLTQATGTKQPLWESGILGSRAGITFDGINDVLSGAFALAVPCSIYAVIKRVTAQNSNNGIWCDRNGTTNVICRDGGTGIPNNAYWPSTNNNWIYTLGTWGIMGASPASSTYRAKTNLAASTTENIGFGSGDLAGFTLGTIGGVNGATCANFIIMESLVYNVAHTDAQMDEIHASLNTRNGLGLS